MTRENEVLEKISKDDAYSIDKDTQEKEIVEYLKLNGFIYIPYKYTYKLTKKGLEAIKVGGYDKYIKHKKMIKNLKLVKILLLVIIPIISVVLTIIKLLN